MVMPGTIYRVYILRIISAFTIYANNISIYNIYGGNRSMITGFFTSIIF